MTQASSKALEKLKAQFDKSYGVGTLSVKEKNVYDTISTGSIALDRAMSAGGYVIGRETEVWGPPDGGKSSLALTAAGEAQRKFKDKFVIFVDVEHKYDPSWARALGADPSRILHIDPLTAENTADMVKDAIRSDAASMVIVDSIGAVLTHKEFEKAADESDMGKRAQVVGRMILIACGLAPRHEVAVLVLNQARANFGYGADTQSAGGFIPAHASTHKLNVKRASTPYTTGSGDKQYDIGYEMGVKVQRSKIGPSGRNVKFDFYTSETADHPIGIDKAQEAIILGPQYGVIQKAGSWLTLPNGERYQSKDAAIEALRSNPKMIEDLREKILASVASEIVEAEPPTLTDEQKKVITEPPTRGAKRGKQ